jgi:pimeloyl-ACP methyl ester carboxylesterase
MAVDIHELTVSLELDRVRIVGHDWGAWIGYLLALRRPELVERLVMLSVPPPTPTPSLRGLLSARNWGYQATIASPMGPRLLRRPSYVARKVRRWARNREHVRNDVQRLYGRDLRASTRARAAQQLYRTYLLRELGPILRGRYRKERLGVPTLVLHGERDPIAPPSLYHGHERFAPAEPAVT